MRTETLVNAGGYRCVLAQAIDLGETRKQVSMMNRCSPLLRTMFVLFTTAAVSTASNIYSVSPIHFPSGFTNVSRFHVWHQQLRPSGGVRHQQRRSSTCVHRHHLGQHDHPASLRLERRVWHRDKSFGPSGGVRGRRIRQTSSASPAEPGDLPTY